MYHIVLCGFRAIHQYDFYNFCDIVSHGDFVLFIFVAYNYGCLSYFSGHEKKGRIQINTIILKPFGFPKGFLIGD